MTYETKLRRLPAETPRVETGPTQFGDDWPGVFIRGDNANHYARHLGILLDHNADETAKALSRAVVQGLKIDLESCDVRRLEKAR